MDAQLLRVAADQIGPGEVRILVGIGHDLAVRGDRGERDVPGGIIGLRRSAVILDFVRRQEVVVHLVREQVCRIDPVAAGECLDDRAGRAIDEVPGDAAIFVARLKQQLPAHAVAVAVVDIGLLQRVIGIAVAAIVIAAQAERDRVADRPGDRTLQHHRIVIAIGRLGRPAEGKGRLRGDDADDAGRRILPEQRRLWPAQHLDPLEIG